jgi:hypothetical protein
MQSVPIITKVESLNFAHGEVYSIQHYVLKFDCQWLAAGRWFSLGTSVSSTNKTDCHDITDILLSEWVSEWQLFNANSAIFQLYHDENKLIFNEMMMRSALFLTSKLSWSWISIVLAHWKNSPRVVMSFHADTLFWFQANQSLLVLLNAACLAEKQHIPIV